MKPSTIWALVGALALVAACQQQAPDAAQGKAADGGSQDSSAVNAVGAPDAVSPVIGAQPDVSGAEQLVRGINAPEYMPVDDKAIDAFFATDLATKLKADRRTVGDMPMVDFDYRWNAQDFEITSSSYQATPAGADRAVVKVDFVNFNTPNATVYDLCRRASGEWRIYDVRSGDGDDSSLRLLLNLKKGEVTAC